MKNIYLYPIVALLALSINIGFAQKSGYRSNLKQRMADKAFGRLHFAEASIMYEELLKTENSGVENKSKLALCYYKMNDSRRAENMYCLLYTSDAADE